MAKLDGFFDNVYHRNSKLFIKIGKCNEDLLRQRIKKITKSLAFYRFEEILIMSLVDGKESITDYGCFKTSKNFQSDNEAIKELRTIKHKVYLQLKGF